MPFKVKECLSSNQIRLQYREVCKLCQARNLPRQAGNMLTAERQMLQMFEEAQTCGEVVQACSAPLFFVCRDVEALQITA